MSKAKPKIIRQYQIHFSWILYGFPQIFFNYGKLIIFFLKKEKQESKEHGQNYHRYKCN
jgi:hypothetical protein